MRLALIGANPTSIKLLSSATEHELVSFVEEGEYKQEIQNLFPTAKPAVTWEELLSGKEVDAVVVAGKAIDQQQEDRLRKLVQEAVPVLLIHPACDVIFGLELEMIRQDTGCLMMAYAPFRHHSLVVKIKSWIDDVEESPIGSVEQLTIRQHMPERDRDSVLKQFSQDAELFRYLLNDVTKVTATGAELDASDFSLLSVQLTGKNKVVASWSSVAGQQPQATLEVAGSEATASFLLLDEGVIEFSSSKNEETIRVQEDEAQATWQIFQQSLENKVEDTADSWNTIAHSLEIVDSTLYSLKRKRTIELREEELSEQSTFKGMMAAGGCFLLLWSMMILFLATLASMFDDFAIARWLNAYWPLALVLPLLIFLGLQSLQLVFVKPAADNGESKNVDK